MRMRVPSDASVAERPRPRNDSVASMMMASASPMVAMTSTGPSTLGRDVPHDDQRGRQAGDLRRLDVLLALLDHGRPPHRTCVLHPRGDADGEDDDMDRDVRVQLARQHRSDQTVDEKGDQDRGERELHIRDPHDHAVDEPPEIAGDEAEADADDHANANRAEADQQGDARSVEGSRTGCRGPGRPSRGEMPLFPRRPRREAETRPTGRGSPGRTGYAAQSTARAPPRARPAR